MKHHSIENPQAKCSVVAVVVTWNSAKFIRECLESLSRSHHPVQVVVVDNDSHDGTDDIVKEHFSQFTFISSGANLGYAGGNNLGIQVGLDREADYIFILNPDAVVDPECVGRLVQRLEKDRDVAIVSPKIYVSGSDTIWYAGSSIDWKTGRTPHHGAGIKDNGTFDAAEYTERASGCAMLARANLITRVGDLDEQYFLYYEETDWSVRFTDCGYRIGFVASAKVWHAVSLSTGGYAEPTYQYYMARNQLLFMKQHSKGSFPLFLIRFIMQVALRAVLLIRGSSLKASWQYVRTCAIASSDFFRHRFGRRTNPIT